MTVRIPAVYRAAVWAALFGLMAAATPATGPSALAGESHQFESLARGGMLLRPRDAASADGTPIVLYPKQEWRCMTWRIQPAGDDTVRLVNYFTHKTFYPETPTGDAVMQHPVTDPPTAAERWRLVPTSGGAFRLDHLGTGKTLTVTDDGTLVVGPWTNAASQQWRLLDKPQHFTG